MFLAVRFKLIFLIVLFIYSLVPYDMAFSESSGADISILYFMPVGDHSNPFTRMAEVGIHLSASLYPNVKASRVYLYHDKQISDFIKGVLSAGGHDYIVGIGSNYASIFDELADIYKDKYFIVIDAKSLNKKVKSIEFDNYEAGYMAGVTAAFVTKSGKTGFIGGARDKVIIDFEKGFKAAILKFGARIDEKNILVDYISDGVEGFSNAGAGKNIADKMYAAGCDIIFAAAGASGFGSIESAEKNGRYIIGVDSDQDGLAPGRVVTSIIKRLDSAVMDLSKNISSGKFDTKPVVYSFKNVGLTFSSFKYTKNKIGRKKYNKILNAMFYR